MLLVAISYTSSQSMTIYPFIFTVQLDFQWLAAFVCFRLLAFLYLPPCCSDPKSDRCVQVVLDSNPAYRLVTQGWFLAQWICQKMTLNSFCLEIQVEVYNLYSRNPRKSHDFSLTFRVLPPVVFFLVGRRLMVMLKCCRQNPASRISCVLLYILPCYRSGSQQQRLNMVSISLTLPEANMGFGLFSGARCWFQER